MAKYRTSRDLLRRELKAMLGNIDWVHAHCEKIHTMINCSPTQYGKTGEQLSHWIVTIAKLSQMLKELIDSMLKSI